jgi:hypothetical protein
MIRALYKAMPAVLLLVLLLPIGCGGRQPEPTRSPTVDYPPPPARSSSDGRVLGADEVPPDDKLATSPTLGSEGLRPAAQPTGPEHPDDHDAEPLGPCAETGRVGPSRQRDCPPPTGVPDTK